MTAPKFTEFKTCQDGQLCAMLAAGQAFARAMAEDTKPPCWLSFLGSSGAGKTFLADLILNYAESLPHLKAHKTLIHPFRRHVWQDFADRLIKDPWLMDQAAAANVLMLDDIGADYDKSGWRKERLCKLLNQRCGKWTLITSNLLLGQIAERIDTRVSSRLIRGGSVFVEVNTTDFNLRK